MAFMDAYCTVQNYFHCLWSTYNYCRVDFISATLSCASHFSYVVGTGLILRFFVIIVTANLIRLMNHSPLNIKTQCR